MKTKLEELINLSKCSVTISVNDHRDNRMSVVDFLDTNRDLPQPDKETLEVMISTDTHISLQFYPLTPVGFVYIVGYDLEKMLDRALDYFKCSTE